MNLFYAVWDYGERQIFRRDHQSCCEILTASIGGSPQGEVSPSKGELTSGWALLWIVIECGVFISSVFIGMKLFPVGTCPLGVH